MKLNYALKAGFAAVALAATGVASADPFYIEVPLAEDSSGARACASTPTSSCTGIKNQFTFSYDSRTTDIDADASGTINAGDGISTIAGISVPGKLWNGNKVTGFLPTGSAPTSDNGYGFGGWEIGMRTTPLTGIITSIAGGGVPQLAYGPGGKVELLYSTDGGVTFINFMDILISGGGSSGGGTVLFGSVDFSDVDVAATPALKSLFHSGTQNCFGDSSFYAIATTCGPALIQFSSSQDTDVTLSSFSAGPAPGTFTVTSDHDGSGKFAIPEPGSLALMGLALAGLGLTQRRRKAV